MDRKELIRLYLDAEATVEQEKELADSFTANPPADKEEMAVFRMLQDIEPLRTDDLPDAEKEFDMIVGRSRNRFFRTVGLSVAGIAAAIVAVVLFTGRPEAPQPLPAQNNEMADLLQKLAIMSNFDPTEADRFDFKPVGDGFVMTAHFPDGQSASYILTPLDGGESFNLISLNN